VSREFHPDTAMPDLFRARWRSGQHVGGATPHMVVEIQKGRFKHGEYAWVGDDVDAIIPGESKARPFRAKWVSESEWLAIPGILEFKTQQDFSANGISVASLTIENVGYVEKTSPLGGVYHLIEQGYLSPFRGYNPPDRPGKPGVKKNSWFDLLARAARVRVWQGYGAPERNDDGSMPDDGGSNGAWVFNGHIDDIDPSSSPHQISVTLRMAKKVTDQRLFGWAKSRTILDPVIFADRLEADKVRAEGGGAAASSDARQHPARFVADKSSKTQWQSVSHSSENVTEWVEVRLPAGRYKDFLVHPAFAGMDLYVGFYARKRFGAYNPTVDGEERPEGWVHMGKGDVPGDHGGWPYMKVMRRHSKELRVHDLGAEIVTGDDAVLRIGFRRLAKGANSYRAGCVRLAARHRIEDDAEEKRRWILVDDVSDMVKVLLRWAGYDEWEIEQTGVRLKGKLVLNRSNFHIDGIRKAVEQTGFVFYVDDPSHGESFGVPVFRRNSAMEAYDGIQEIRDTDLLTGIKVKVSEEPLAYNIRIRGREAPESKGGRTDGSSTKRTILAYYKPPWSRRGRLAGVLKHVTHTFPELRSFDECLVAAYQTAFEQALQAVTGVIETPGNPFFRLDSQVGVLDTGTGMNTRLWIANRDSTFRTGRNASWKTTLGGSMIDTPDLVQLIAEMDSDMPNPKGVSNGSTYSVG